MGLGLGLGDWGLGRDSKSNQMGSKHRVGGIGRFGDKGSMLVHLDRRLGLGRDRRLVVAVAVAVVVVVVVVVVVGVAFDLLVAAAAVAVVGIVGIGLGVVVGIRREMSNP